MQTGKIICYCLNGQPIGLTRYGNRWWQATANEPLHPLRESLFKEDSSSAKLCGVCLSASARLEETLDTSRKL